MEVSKRKQRLEEIKEFSRHQQDFADKIMDLLGEGKAANYAKVCRLATYMSTVPTSAEVRAGWKEFLGDMSVLLKLAEQKQLDHSMMVSGEAKPLALMSTLSSREKVELEELEVLKMHGSNLTMKKMSRLKDLRGRDTDNFRMTVPDDLYGIISKRKPRQQISAQSVEMPMPEMLNLPKPNNDKL